MQRGTFTALVGLILFIIIISITYTMLADVDVQKSFGTVKTAGEVKRTFNKMRYLADKAAAQAMADFALDNFEKLGVCQEDWDYSSKINEYLDSIRREIKTDTGIDCSFAPVSQVSDNTPFDLRLTCSISVAKGGLFWYNIFTSDSFSLHKDVTATFDGLVCSVGVQDMQSGLTDV